MEKPTIEKSIILLEEIRKLLIANYNDRPNAVASFGTAKLSSRDVKEIFDKQFKFLAEKHNTLASGTAAEIEKHKSDVSDELDAMQKALEAELVGIYKNVLEKIILKTKDAVAINGEVRYPSEGLEYVVSDDGTEAAVIGIGMCTDINVVVPRSYNGVPITGVLNNAFENAQIDSINLFEGVTFIGAEAFKGSPVRFIYMYSTAPFEVGEGAFDDTVKGLFVPLHSVDAYKENEAWSAYADKIVAIETFESTNTHIVRLALSDAALQKAIENLAQVDANLAQVDTNLQTQIHNLVQVDRNLLNILNGKCDTNVMLINHQNQQNQIDGLKLQIGEINGKLGTAGVISFIIVTELPIENIVENAIYLVPAEDGAEPNLFDEFVYIDGSWEQMGSANVSIDLTEYLKKSDAANAGQIAEKTRTNKYLSPYYLDEIMRIGLTTNAKVLTDEEKAAALEWLGAVPKQKGEPDSGATRGFAYGLASDGETVQLYRLQIQSNVGTIPIRNASGNFYVGTPTLKYEAANKDYVDTLFNSIVNGEEVEY